MISITHIKPFNRIFKPFTAILTFNRIIKGSESIIAKPVFEKLKKKGVKIKVAAPITKENKAAAKDLSTVAEVKNTDAKARFIIVDGKELIFMVLDDEEVHAQNKNYGNRKKNDSNTKR